MIISKPNTTNIENGKAYEQVDSINLNPTQQRSYLEQAIKPGSGVNLKFGENECEVLLQEKLLNHLGFEVTLQTDDQIQEIYTYAQNVHTPPDYRVGINGKNEVKVFLHAVTKLQKSHIVGTAEPQKFKDIVTSKLLKPETKI